MTRPARALAIAAAAVAASITVHAQEVFRAGTDLVVLSVTVSGADGHFLAGLRQGDFQIFEDGVPQDVAVFLTEPQPIALSLLIDSSSSMDTKMAIAQDAAIGFVRKLRPGDLAQVVDFDSQPQIVQAFTADKVALERAIRRTEPGGSTSLYQSLYIAIDELKRLRAAATDQASTTRRHAIVVLSDGEDNTSLIDYEQVLDASRRGVACVYGVALRTKEEAAAREYRQADFVMRTLTQETGGRVFFVSEPTQLPAVYRQIADEIGGQYTIGYRSKNLKRDGAWRRIAVRIAPGGAVARTRSGYFAAKARP